MFNCDSAPTSYLLTALNRAYKMLQDEEQKDFLVGVVEEAKGMVEMKVHIYIHAQFIYITSK